MNELYQKLAELCKGQRSRLLLFVGIAGMALILVSSVFPPQAKTNPPMGTPEQTPEAYAAQMEQRLTDLVGKVDGVGKCEVMVTTENGVEYVYAVEQSQNVNETSSYEGEQARRLTQQQNNAQKYILLDAGSGKKEALLKTRRQPTIKGVVVVCEGAGSAIVQERVTQVVTTALGIPYHKVCVTKICQ